MPGQRAGGEQCDRGGLASGSPPCTKSLVACDLRSPAGRVARRRDGTREDEERIMTGSAAVRGMMAGAVGVAAMTLAEKLEQRLTGRPNSFVPAHTLESLLGLPHKPDEERLGMNWTMHWGQGILLGAVRGLMAERGIRGPVGSFLFMNLRLLNDQSLENATGVGAPPWTWPADEQVIDLLHKAVYAFATGAVADQLIAGPRTSPDWRKGWTPGAKA
ncbi:MAG: hypothetical protein M3P51_04220 [Chloroflexota bacterium]|nr:hypothetical protein [Chloroflexota bacterium]